jgi:hypothetical protein
VGRRLIFLIKENAMSVSTAPAQAMAGKGVARDIRQNMMNDGMAGAATASAINSQNNTSVLNSARVGNEIFHKFTKSGLEASKGLVT